MDSQRRVIEGVDSQRVMEGVDSQRVGMRKRVRMA